MASIMCLVELSVPDLSLLRDVLSGEYRKQYKLREDLNDKGQFSMAYLTLETMQRISAINDKFAEILASDDSDG